MRYELRKALANRADSIGATLNPTTTPNLTFLNPGSPRSDFDPVSCTTFRSMKRDILPIFRLTFRFQASDNAGLR